MKTAYELRRVLEYSKFFPHDNKLDVTETLKMFSRSDLVRMATIASLHYGNYDASDNRKRFFSSESEKYRIYIDQHFADYLKQNDLSINARILVFTYRSILELWRNIFSIQKEDYHETIAKEDAEITLFKVILTLNERILAIKDNDSHTFKIDELLFLNGYLTNDMNLYGFKEIMQPQVYYFIHFVDNIPNDETLVKATAKLHKTWGITSWKQYFATILFIAKETERYRLEAKGGLPVLSLQRLHDIDETGLLSSSLIHALSIEEDEYFPYDDNEAKRGERNVDYRRFRSKPLIKLKDKDEYVVINIQLICERLYNSLFFDYLPLINGSKNSVGNYDFNKTFVEQWLFRKTMFGCLASSEYMYPPYNNFDKEEDKAPDFYVRYPDGKLVVMECKAIKMNGSIRDDGDFMRLLDELHEKIVLKTHNLDSTRKPMKGDQEQIGVGQLINHIDSIEANTFIWDKNIPDDVAYYPILVFEDVRLLQKGLLSIVNRWFYEQIRTKKEIVLTDICIMPVMVMSINTLYLYNDYLLNNRLSNVVDDFVKHYCKYDKNTGKYQIPADADFDGYLRKMPFNKTDILSDLIRLGVKK